MTIEEIVNKAREIANIESDYALAKVLDVNNGDIAHWRKGTKHPSTEAATKLAILAKIPEMAVIAQIELLTAKTAVKKKFWKDYIESRGIVSTILLTALTASILLTPDTANASVLQLHNYGGKNFAYMYDFYTLCESQIKSIRFIFKVLFGKWLQLLNPYHSAHNYKFTIPVTESEAKWCAKSIGATLLARSLLQGIKSIGK